MNARRLRDAMASIGREVATGIDALDIVTGKGASRVEEIVQGDPERMRTVAKGLRVIGAKVLAGKIEARAEKIKVDG